MVPVQQRVDLGHHDAAVDAGGEGIEGDLVRLAAGADALAHAPHLGPLA